MDTFPGVVRFSAYVMRLMLTRDSQRCWHAWSSKSA